MQNNLSDLNNHLFAQLELLENGELSEKELDLELKKQKQSHKFLRKFLIKYYGNGGTHPVGIPLPTITTKDRFAVCGTTDGIELGFRMLQPKELAAATGFPADYKFTGTKVEVIKQIGNAVPPDFAKAIFGQILKEMTA